MVYDLLTELDKKKIESYRDEFAHIYGHGEPAPLETILQHWNNAKSGYLSKLFGNQLIVTKDIEFKEGVYETEDRIREIIYQDDRVINFRNQICEIYKKRAQDCIEWQDPLEQQRRFVRTLFDTYWLAVNRVDDSYFSQSKKTFELPIGNKTLNIQKGMKPMRVISKIANAYGIGVVPDKKGVSDFEYFRRRHSVGLNQKLLKGKLCLSIHPLDYMTMSDNEEGWSSCMSWMEDGEYKQGTVEMMNSPCVVVGYLSANSNKFTWGNKDEQCWNSKKWRSLFIVDPNFIINIKSYPYDNSNLVMEVIKELGKMSGWGEVQPQLFEYFENSREYRWEKKPVIINNRKIAIDLHTQAMYNDFGHSHYIVLNPNDTEDYLNFDYCYSGTSECVWCGETDIDLVGESQGPDLLHCNNCDPRYYCSCCGERYSEDEYLYTLANGVEVCEYCWDHETQTDIIDGCSYLENDMERICLSKDPEDIDIHSAKVCYVYETNIGTERWNELFKISKFRYGKDRFNAYVQYLLVSDCTEEGLAAFGLEDEESIKEYLGLNEA